MKTTIVRFTVLSLLLSGPALLLAHEEPHDDSTQTTQADQETQNTNDEEGITENAENTALSSAGEEASDAEQKETSLFAPFRDFPNLHPLVVHFPIVLLLLAVLTQFAGVFIFRKELSWVTLFLLLTGFAGAILASQVFHPHASGLTDKVQEILETHEQYASLTMWLSGIALLFKIISHFFLERKPWAEWIIFIVIAGSALTVGLAGHLGSQMVYLEDVGPKGNKLEQHHEE